MEESKTTRQVWEDVLKVGRTLEKKQTHELEDPFIETILATFEYYGATRSQLGLIYFDLVKARYKIYDWLGMCLDGRLDAEEGSQVHDLLIKLGKLYTMQEHVGGFAWFLRGHDLDVEQVARCSDCIKSYDDWHSMTPEERLKEQKEREKFYGGTIDIV